jgi:hypothetical protein
MDSAGSRRHPEAPAELAEGPVERASASLLQRVQSNAQDTHPHKPKGHSP